MNLGMKNKAYAEINSEMSEGAERGGFIYQK